MPHGYRVKLISWRTQSGGPTADKTRLVKRVAAGVLFSATLGLAISAKRSKRKQMDEYFEGCQRLPTDADFTSGAGAELYCYKQCVFPASTIRSGTLKRLETFTTNPGDVIVASFPKSGNPARQSFKKEN